MQNLLSNDDLKELNKDRMKRLETHLREVLSGCLNHEMIICPFCQYQNRRGKGTAKVFEDGDKKSFKCFACGIWRRV